jgi:hypothetical protein
MSRSTGRNAHSDECAYRIALLRAARALTVKPDLIAAAQRAGPSQGLFGPSAQFDHRAFSKSHPILSRDAPPAVEHRFGTVHLIHWLASSILRRFPCNTPLRNSAWIRFAASARKTGTRRRVDVPPGRAARAKCASRAPRALGEAEPGAGIPENVGPPPQLSVTASTAW